MIKIKKFQQVKEMITQLIFLPDYNYFNKNHKMIVIDLCKEQALEVDPKSIQQINFTGDLDRP